jgi:2,4-diketo-3-deoxy-L-fuconate hydrolase
MAVTMYRYQSGDGPRWARAVGPIGCIDVGACTTTGDLVRSADRLVFGEVPDGPVLAIAELALLSPVTRNQQVICQGTNYADHRAEVGIKDRKADFNMMFRKASSSLSAGVDPIPLPPHVDLLDYEIELGLVLRADVRGPRSVSEADLPDYIAALTIFDDISARDIQIPQMQFYKGKSYRGFGPTGPGLVFLEPDDFRALPRLRLALSVNGKIRQSAQVVDMIHKPAATLSELSGLQDLEAGDLIATGTPGGVALHVPGAIMQKVAALLPERVKWRLFRNGQSKFDYLRLGDVVTATIRTDDGALDLGCQRNLVVPGSPVFIPEEPPALVERLQHFVYFVDSLEESRDFYTDVLGLQWSARNHPESSAAMKLSGMEMNFFSFGYWHHDICFVKHREFDAEKGHFEVIGLNLRKGEHMDAVKMRLRARGTPHTDGRYLPSLDPSRDANAIWFRDPTGHVVELVSTPVESSASLQHA